MQASTSPGWIAVVLCTLSHFAYGGPILSVAEVRSSDGADKIAAAISVVESLTPDAMQTDWSTCREIIANPESPSAVRVRLATRVLTTGTTETKEKLLQLLTEWQSQRSGEWRARDPESNLVVYSFQEVVGNPRWEGWKTNADAVLRLLESDPIHGGFEGIKSGTDIVADAPIPDSSKAEWVVRVTLANRSTGGGISRLLALIDERATAQLRDALALSVKSGALNDCVASALAHLGDFPSLPLLREYVETREGYQRPMKELLPYMCWQIEVQHPPEGILKWFKSSGASQNAWYATWAADRAVELGISKPALREALLQFERSLPDESVCGGTAKNGQIITRRPAFLVDLKARMVRAGVLTEADWSTVPSRPDSPADR